MSQSSRRRGRGGQGGREPRMRIRTRELRAMELAVLGWPQHRIAVDLGISQAAVSKLLKRIEGRVLRELAETIERHKAGQTLRLEHQYAEAMRAWEESKADTTRKRQRKTHGGSGGAGATVAEVVVENQHGDPRYLEVARKALADVRKEVESFASDPLGTTSSPAAASPEAAAPSTPAPVSADAAIPQSDAELAAASPQPDAKSGSGA